MSPDEFYRPQYHVSPPRNWMNDPNGLVYYDGEYHLFYQYHPGSTIWGPMHWGHAVSDDLVNWQHLPIALYPDEQGMIFSGSAVVDGNNTAGFGEKALIAIFTYNQAHVETQNLAYSIDRGHTWTKYADNPVIPHPGTLHDFRDPKVFWYEDHWVMCLAAGNAVLFYISSDLKNWQQSGVFGNGYGSTEGVWETPDLFKLLVDNSLETYWVLTVSVGNGHPAGGSGTQYFIGHFNGQSFTSTYPKDTVLWADFGADYYAPQSWNDEPNERRLMIGWMNNWQYANTIPASGWRGALSLIRELSLSRTEEGLRLIQQPIPELRSLRNKNYHWRNEILSPEKNLLADIEGTSLEIVAELQITNNIDRLGFDVRVGDIERTTIGYLAKEKKVFVDRTNSDQSDFDKNFARVHYAVLNCVDHLLRLQIFVDQGSVEIFANDGLVVITDSIFPSTESRKLEISVDGDRARLNLLDVFQLSPAQYTIEETL
jgi:fructan beta-fructosidase